MNIRTELRTFTDDANQKAFEMISAVDDLELGTVPEAAVAKKLDELARDLIGTAEAIKDLASRLETSKPLPTEGKP